MSVIVYITLIPLFMISVVMQGFVVQSVTLAGLSIASIFGVTSISTWY